MASSSTGEQRQAIFRLPAGWLAPRPLCQLALALPGPLRPTSKCLITFFVLAFGDGYRTAEHRTSSFMQLKGSPDVSFLLRRSALEERPAQSRRPHIRLTSEGNSGMVR